MAAQASSSEFERSVFSDRTISADEYKESLDRFAECLSAEGYEIQLQEDSGIFGFVLVGEADDSWDRVSDSCRKGNNLLIEPLYVTSFVNPDHAEFSELVAECLVREGVVDSPFTAADVDAARAEPDADALPWSDSDPIAARCLYRPVR